MLPLAALLLAALATSGTTRASAAERTPVTPLAGEATLDVEGPLALLSVQQQVGHRELRQLVLVRDGRPQVLPVPRSSSLDADLGTDEDGRPAVVLARCTPGCDLYVLRPGVDVAPRRIPGADSPADETTPTLSEGVLAFSRSGRSRRPQVLVRRLAAPASTPSRRVPGVPGRDCAVRVEDDASCVARDPSVVDLELAGTRLAEVVAYEVDSQGGYGTQQLRLVDSERRSSVLVARSTYGEGGQDLLGPSFAGGWLSWYRTCYGDPGGCIGTQGGAFRFRRSSGRYEHADEGYVPLAGYAATAHGASEQVRATSGLLGTGGPSALERTGPLAWRRLPARAVL